MRCTYLTLAVAAAETGGLRLIALPGQSGLRARTGARDATHLDLLATACEAAGLAAGVLGPLALGGGVLLLLSHGAGAGGDDVHVRRACVHLGGIVRVRDVVVGGGGGTGGRASR